MGNTVIQLRNDTAANWTSNNPTLALGEMGLETDTNKIKFGDGSTAWNSLAYFGPTNSSFKYGLYTMSANQTSNLAVNNHVEYNTSEGSLGGLSTGSGQENGIITLAAGKTYKIMFATGVVGSDTGMTAFCLHNRTTSSNVGLVEGHIPTSNTGNASSVMPGLAIISPEESTDVEVRITNAGISVIANYDTWLLIEEYGGY